MIDVILIEMHIIDENVRGQLILVQFQVVLVVVLSVRHQSVSHVHPGDADVGRWRHTSGRQRGGRNDQGATIDSMQAASDASPATLQMPPTRAETRLKNYQTKIKSKETRCTGLGVVMRIPVEAQLADMVPTASSGVTEYA